jgi:hypothetical protein
VLSPQGHVFADSPVVLRTALVLFGLEAIERQGPTPDALAKLEAGRRECQKPTERTSEPSSIG